MWSHLYWYFELRKDATYRHSLQTDFVRNILMETGVFEEEKDQAFRSKKAFPSLHAIAINSEKGSYGSPRHFNSAEVNMISIIGSKSQIENESFYKTLLISIAESLNWQLIAEGEAENGDDVILRESTIN